MVGNVILKATPRSLLPLVLAKIHTHIHIWTRKECERQRKTFASIKHLQVKRIIISQCKRIQTSFQRCLHIWVCTSSLHFFILCCECSSFAIIASFNDWTICIYYMFVSVCDCVYMCAYLCTNDVRLMY